ncbi:hypothetical protein D3876_08420 [Sphingomonas cavernae]|uniref:Uncharacterized protein n=1 Tax=Sphingomonas cavernae TaxID=2320861 RepID=A0A418WJU4_9SPHN|nr:hypothetical protein D3876_08420 [Sphingomonas cavernae]
MITGTNVVLRAPDALVNSGLIRAGVASNITGGDILNTGRLELGGVGSVHARRRPNSRDMRVVTWLLPSAHERRRQHRAERHGVRRSYCR